MKTPERVLRLLSGYLFGITLFLVLIPLGVYFLSGIDRLARILQDSMSIEFRIITAFLIGIPGIIFMMWSNIFLLKVGKGGPAEGFGIEISPRTKDLVTNGPYRLCRNPMVFGALCIYLSIAVFKVSLFAVLCILLFYSIITISVIKSEEQRLSRDFGEQYEAYKRSVPRIIPGILRMFNSKRNDGLLV